MAKKELLEDIASDLSVIIERDDSTSKPRVKLKGIFSTAEVSNKNGRKYKRITLEKIISSRATPEILEVNPLFGEKIHPKKERTGEIDPEFITHKVCWLRMEGDHLMGEIELIPRTKAGEIMCWLVIEHNAKPGISSRAFGSMDGVYVDHDSYDFITYDLTFRPSNPGSLLHAVQESSNIKSLLSECSTDELEILNENFDGMFSGTKNSNSKLNIEPNHKNEEIMSDVKQLIGEVTTLAEENGLLRESTSTLKSSLTESEAKTTELVEANKKLVENQSKYIEVIQKISDKYNSLLKESAEEKSDLENKYDKAITIAEGLKSKMDSLNANYNKSLEVLKRLNDKNFNESVSSFVDNILGKGYYEKNESIFEGIDNFDQVSTIVEAISKQHGNKSPLTSYLPNNPSSNDGNLKKDLFEHVKNPFLTELNESGDSQFSSDPEDGTDPKVLTEAVNKTYTSIGASSGIDFAI